MKKKNKNKEEKIGFRRTVKNMSFALGIVWKNSPVRVIGVILRNVIWAVIGFITGTWLVRYILNSVQTGKKFERIIIVVIAVYALDLIISFLQLLYDRLIEPLERIKVHKKLNHDLLKKVASVDLSCYEDTEFYKRFTMTVPEAKGGVDDGAMEFISDIAYSITYMVTNTAMIMVIDPYMIVLAFIPLLTSLIFGKKANKVQYDYEMTGREIGRDREYVNRIFYLGDYAKEMRMTNIGTVLLKRFRGDLEKSKAATRKYGLKSIRLLFLKGFAEGQVVYFAGILYAAYRLLVSKTILVGDCIVISSVIGGISWGIRYTFDTYIKMNKHAMFLENLRGFMEYEPKIKSAENALLPNTENPVITFNDVRFRYDGVKHDVLKKVSFSIAKGEKIAIVGENGAGKSTLVKLLMRLYDTTSGSVCCDGVNVKDLDLDAYRDMYGVIFQDYRIFAMTVKENVLLGEEGDDETVIEALKAAGVYEKIESLPNGINTELTKEYFEDGEVLSGGEYQKICIARVFAKNAKIVILDEPSSALDPIAEYEMYESLLRVCEGRSVVFISHRLSSAVLADKVIMMQKGRITEMGSHEELMAQKGAYCDMFSKQAENYLGEEVSANEEK